jgi:thiol:disulfide interchange protein DsbD
VDPFSIGLLTFVAAKADPYLGFALFFTLSLGLGLPYLLLGFFSGEIQRLPKSGLWMVWVKKVFGFILLGMPLYFLYAYLPEAEAHWFVATYIALVGILLGFVFSGKGVPKGFEIFQKAFGTAILLGGLALFALWPQPVRLPFEPYSPERMESAQKAGQKVLLDFSAEWCIPCRELELKTFPDPKVREALKGWVLLKADLTKFDDGVTKELRKKWNVSGVPTILLIGSDGKIKGGGRIVGFVGPYDLLTHF